FKKWGRAKITFVQGGPRVQQELVICGVLLRLRQSIVHASVTLLTHPYGGWSVGALRPAEWRNRIHVKIEGLVVAPTRAEYVLKSHARRIHADGAIGRVVLVPRGTRNLGERGNLSQLAGCQANVSLGDDCRHDDQRYRAHVVPEGKV